MKQILTTMKFLTVIALGVFAVSCTTESENKQNLAVAAGFKIITPKNAEQQNILNQLPADKVTQITYQGHTLLRPAGREEQPGLRWSGRRVSGLSAAPSGPAPEQ